MATTGNEPPPIGGSTTPSTPSNPPNPSSPRPRYSQETEVDHHNRLSRPGPARIVFYFTNSLGIFWVIGFLRARRLAAHQFLAENSHRLPTSDAGWYLYHRAKNYRTVWNGFKGGVKYSLAGGACAFFYGYVEEAWDQGVRRGKVDAGGSFVAGTATAGVYALWKGMGLRQSWRYLRVGMGLGLMSGIVQDLLRWGRGAPPWYVENLRRRGIAFKPKNVDNRKP
jgi:hypothetical protein